MLTIRFNIVLQMLIVTAPVFAQRPCDQCTPVDADLGMITPSPCGGTISGNLGNGGKWVGQFIGVAGRAYHWDLCGIPPCNGSENLSPDSDADLFILDELCQIMDYVDGDPQCNFTPNDHVWLCPADGTYFVAIEPWWAFDPPFSCRGNSTHLFTLVYYAESTGRCCYNNGAVCADLTYDQCQHLYGVWDDNSTCSESPCALAPTLCQSRQLGGTSMNSGDWLRSLTETNDCGILNVGWNTSTNGNEDGWLVKSDVNSSVVLDKKFGGLGADRFYRALEMPDGSIYVVGRSGSYGVGGSQDGWLLKLTPEGDTLWTRTYGTVSDDRLYSILSLSSGGFLLSGATQSNSSGGSSDFWLARVDSTGELAWQKRIGGLASDLCWQTCEAADGGFINIGYTESFGSGSADWFVVKTNATGDSLWSRVFGGAEHDQCAAVVPDLEGGAYIVGYEVYVGTRYQDVVFRHLSSSGAELFTTVIDMVLEQQPHDLSLINGNELLAIGETNDSSGVQGLLLRLSTNGEFLWAGSYGENSDRHEHMYGGQLLNDGDIAACGYSVSWSGSAWLYYGESMRMGLCDRHTPIAPTIVIGAHTDDVLLSWSRPLVDQSGCLVNIEQYDVYASDAPEGPFEYEGSTVDTFYVHPDAVANSPLQFYVVRSSIESPPIHRSASESSRLGTSPSTLPHLNLEVLR